MKKTITTLIMATAISSASAQSTIVKGARVPQLTSAERNTISAVNANTAKGQIVFNNDSTRLEFFDGKHWVDALTPRWFYMPSIPIDVSQNVTDAQIDLWQEYYSDFDGSGSRVIGSAGAPVQPQKKYQKNELYYYVTGYDSRVFKNLSINADGVMTYSIEASEVTDATFINIVFVVK